MNRSRNVTPLFYFLGGVLCPVIWDSSYRRNGRAALDIRQECSSSLLLWRGAGGEVYRQECYVLPFEIPPIIGMEEPHRVSGKSAAPPFSYGERLGGGLYSKGFTYCIWDSSYHRNGRAAPRIRQECSSSLLLWRGVGGEVYRQECLRSDTTCRCEEEWRSNLRGWVGPILLRTAATINLL